MKSIRIIAAITVAASALLLTGCDSDSMHRAESNPAGGAWLTTEIGDVWCVQGSNYGGNTTSCQWSSLTTKGSHGDTRKVDGSYHYVIDANKVQRKVFCADYEVRGYNVMDCNWPNAER